VTHLFLSVDETLAFCPLPFFPIELKRSQVEHRRHPSSIPAIPRCPTPTPCAQSCLTLPYTSIALHASY
jgi:hypothetical protein